MFETKHKHYNKDKLVEGTRKNGSELDLTW